MPYFKSMAIGLRLEKRSKHFFKRANKEYCLLNDLKQKIYIAGHKGMVGSAIVRELERKGHSNLVYRTHQELDLTNQAAVQHFFELEKPNQAYLAAAKVGGIYANNTYPAEFIYNNLMVQNNVIHQAFMNGVRKLFF